MGSYGAESKKPSYLYSIGPWVSRLVRTVDKHYKGTVCTASSKVVNGVKQVTGTKHLKGTQHYTKAFGVAVHQSWRKHVRMHPAEPQDLDTEDTDDEGIVFGRSNWHGSEMTSLCAELKLPVDRLAF